MTDSVDRANERRDLIESKCLEAHFERVNSEKPYEVNGTRLCLDCGEPINPQRLEAYPKAVRCIECQTFHE